MQALRSALNSEKKVSTDVGTESVGNNFLRLLRQLEDPRISIYLALLRYNLLTLKAIMKETGLFRDKMKRALTWMVRQGFLSRMYIYEKGTRKVAYHIRGVTQTLALQLEIDANTGRQIAITQGGCD